MPPALLAAMLATAVELVPVSDGAHGWAGFIDGPIESGLRAARRLAAEGTAGRAG